MILVDTSVIARLPNAVDPHRSITQSALSKFKANRESLVIAAQCLYEFWVIATRPAKDNGFEFSPSRTSRWLQYFQRMATLLTDDVSVYYHWENLVTSQGTKGKPAHDAHLVAWMHIHGVSSVLTFNGAHVARYGVKVLDPADV